ncbi:hypothetical protein B0H14DRAFT_2632847 [Mycena olivaceomarginata]|nr:hypothetical protein B0H14DRAFT_2632847 [Mycena olivaceomarginata]
MLAKFCPFFLKQLTIAGEEWLEMPAPPAGSRSQPLQETAGARDLAESRLRSTANRRAARSEGDHPQGARTPGLIWNFRFTYIWGSWNRRERDVLREYRRLS